MNKKQDFFSRPLEKLECKNGSVLWLFSRRCAWKEKEGFRVIAPTQKCYLTKVNCMRHAITATLKTAQKPIPGPELHHHFPSPTALLFYLYASLSGETPKS